MRTHATRSTQGVLRMPLVWIVGVLVLGACSVLIAGKSDYADYRSVALAADEHQRLHALERYVVNHPKGRWIGELGGERNRREPDVWAANRSTRDGLEFYLQVYPDGPHAAEARPRLAALQRVQGRREEEAAQAHEVIEHRAEERAEAQRQWVTSAVQFWSKTLLSVTNWGSALGDVARRNAEFSRAFGREPRPRCSRTECTKSYGASFGIPVPGSTRIERRMDLVLRLKTPDGRLTRVEVLMPGKGFSRWFELENRTPIVDEDPTLREQATTWALERIAAAVHEAVPGASETTGVTLRPIVPPGGAATPTPAATTTTVDEGPDTPQASTPADGGTAATADGGTPAPDAAPDGGTGGPLDGNTQLDELLQRAAGTNEQSTTADAGSPAPGTETAPTPEAATTQAAAAVAPVVLKAWRVGAVRIVAFIAGADDYGTAYDGLVIEMN